VTLEEGTGRIGAVDLEALVLGPVALDEPDVVEQRAHVEQLGVVLQAAPPPPQRAPQEHAVRMAEQDRRRDVAHELRGLARDRAVGDRDPGDGGIHARHTVERAGARRGR
jgi:hypothetical protein